MMNLIISCTNMNTIDLHHAGSFYQPGNLKFTLFYQLVTCYQLVTRQKLVTSLVTKLVVLRCSQRVRCLAVRPSEPSSNLIPQEGRQLRACTSEHTR